MLANVRRIYYDVSNGNKLAEVVFFGYVKPSTIEQDITVHKALSERNRGTFDVIELEYSQYSQDFAECDGYRINPQTKEIEFSYPDPNQPEQPPVYRQALTEQIAEVKASNLALAETVDNILTDVIPTLLG